MSGTAFGQRQTDRVHCRCVEFAPNAIADGKSIADMLVAGRDSRGLQHHSCGRERCAHRKQHPRPVGAGHDGQRVPRKLALVMSSPCSVRQLQLSRGSRSASRWNVGEQRLRCGHRMIGQHPAATADGDDRFRAQLSAHPYQHAVAATLVQFRKASVAGQLTTTNHAIPVGHQHGQHSPLLSALIREGVGIEARSRSRAGHGAETRAFGFHDCSTCVNAA